MVRAFALFGTYDGDVLFSRSDRTWQLELTRDGHVLIEQVHLGTHTPQRTEYPTEDDAIKAHRERVVKLIVEDEWQVASVNDDAAWPVARDLAMEQAILDATDDRRERLAVYTDWLIERGDPCGELAALRSRADRDPIAIVEAVAQHEAQHADALFGPISALPPSTSPRGLVWHWQDGWIEAFELDGTSATQLNLALHAPMARFVRRLIIRWRFSPAIGPALAMWPRRGQIRALELQHASQHAHEILDALPALEHVAMPAGSRTPKGHPTVRSLELAVDNEHRRLVGPWPALRALRLRAISDAPGLDELFLGALLPEVRELELSGTRAGVATLAATLGRHAFTHQLERLRITQPVEDATLAALARFPDLVVST